MPAIALSDNQMRELRACAATLPVELRSGLLQLIAGYLKAEGGLTDASFQRALAFALDQLPGQDSANECVCSR